MAQKRIDMTKMVEKTIPDQLRRIDEETAGLKTQRPRLTKELQGINDAINEVNVAEAQLSGQGLMPISKQLQPTFKSAILEKDIVDYSQVLDKILGRLNQFREMLPELSEVHDEDLVQSEQEVQVDKSATFYEGSPSYQDANSRVTTPQQSKSGVQMSASGQSYVMSASGQLIPSPSPARSPFNMSNNSNTMAFLTEGLGLDIVQKV